MIKDNKVFEPQFPTRDEEIAYLKRKIDFLYSHAEQLAYRQVIDKTAQYTFQLKELKEIKNSRSWRITRPLRKANSLLRKLRDKL